MATTYVEPDSARATAFYVKALAILGFASVVSGVGVGIAILLNNPVPLIAAGLVVLGMLYMAGEAYFNGNRNMKWSTMESDEEDDEEDEEAS